MKKLLIWIVISALLLSSITACTSSGTNPEESGSIVTVPTDAPEPAVTPAPEDDDEEIDVDYSYLLSILINEGRKKKQTMTDRCAISSLRNVHLRIADPLYNNSHINL